jgi:hypothetical protein
MNVQLYIDLSSVIVGALSGALHAASKRFDVIGVMTIGIIGGLGGGMLRDVIVADGPPLALRHSEYLLTAAGTTFVGLLFQGFVRRMQLAIWILDTLTLGTFTVAAMDRAIAIGLPSSSSLFVGVIAGVGGTFIRDVVCRDVPPCSCAGSPMRRLRFSVAWCISWPRLWRCRCRGSIGSPSCAFSPFASPPRGGGGRCPTPTTSIAI